MPPGEIKKLKALVNTYFTVRLQSLYQDVKSVAVYESQFGGGRFALEERLREALPVYHRFQEHHVQIANIRTQIASLSGFIQEKGLVRPDGLLTPATNFEIQGGNATNFACSFFPLVGEKQDIECVFDPYSTPFERNFAAGSLLLSVFTAGFGPNASAYRSAERSVESIAVHGNKSAMAMTGSSVIHVGSDGSFGSRPTMLNHVGVTRQQGNTCVASCLDMLIPHRSTTIIENYSITKEGLKPHSMGAFLRQNILENGLEPITGSIEEALRSGKRFIAILDDPTVGGHAVIIEGVEMMHGIPHVLVRDPAYGAYFENLEWFLTQRRTTDPSLKFDAVWTKGGAF